MAVGGSNQGLKLDLVIGHPGWGELLAIKDVLPGVPVLHHLEFFYQLEGADSGFDPEIIQARWSSQARLRLQRAPQLLALAASDKPDGMSGKGALRETPWVRA